MKHSTVFEDLLVKHGAVVEVSISEYGQGIARVPNFVFRYDSSGVQVGVAKTFDRWANSIDAFLDRTPQDDLGIRVMLETLNHLLETKRFSSGWGEGLDLAVFMRKIRKSLKRQDREAMNEAELLVAA